MDFNPECRSCARLVRYRRKLSARVLLDHENDAVA